jgi:hypothetical protein
MTIDLENRPTPETDVLLERGVHVAGLIDHARRR